MRLRLKFLEDFMLTKTNSEGMTVQGFQGNVLNFCGPESLERPGQKKMALDELIGTVKMIWLELTEPPTGFSWSKYEEIGALHIKIEKVEFQLRSISES